MSKYFGIFFENLAVFTFLEELLRSLLTSALIRKERGKYQNFYSLLFACFGICNCVTQSLFLTWRGLSIQRIHGCWGELVQDGWDHLPQESPEMIMTTIQVTITILVDNKFVWQWMVPWSNYHVSLWDFQRSSTECFLWIHTGRVWSGIHFSSSKHEILWVDITFKVQYLPFENSFSFITYFHYKE